MTEHDFCRAVLKGARDDFKKKFGFHLKLRVSSMAFCGWKKDYEVRLHPHHSYDTFQKVIATSNCCSYDAKTQALCEFIDEESEYEFDKRRKAIRNYN